MPIIDSYEEAKEHRRQRLENSRIARENISTGCVLTCILPSILFLVMVGMSMVCFFNTDSFYCFILSALGLAAFIGGLISLCICYGDLHVPRPGQVVYGSNGQAYIVPEPRQPVALEPLVNQQQQHQQHQRHAVRPPNRSPTRSPHLGSRNPSSAPVNVDWYREPNQGAPPPSYSLIMGKSGNQLISSEGNKMVHYGNI